MDQCAKLGLENLVLVRAEERRVMVDVDEEYLREISNLDGCYAIKTELPGDAADMASMIATRTWHWLSRASER